MTMEPVPGVIVSEGSPLRDALVALSREARMIFFAETITHAEHSDIANAADLLARACPRGTRPELLAVGPTTAASARAAGWSPSAVASEPTARALASAIRSLLASR